MPKKLKKWIAVFLCVVMAAGAMPLSDFGRLFAARSAVSALAWDNGEETTGDDSSYEYESTSDPGTEQPEGSFPVRFLYYPASDFEETLDRFVTPGENGGATVDFPTAEELNGVCFRENGVTYRLLGWNLNDAGEEYGGFGAVASLPAPADAVNGYTYYHSTDYVYRSGHYSAQLRLYKDSSYYPVYEMTMYVGTYIRLIKR